MSRVTTSIVGAVWIVTVALAGGLRCSSSMVPEAPREAPVTLRAIYGLDKARSIDPRSTALVLVDYQEEFFHGRLPVEGGGATVARAAELRAWARRAGVLVVHVRNVAARADSPVFAASSPHAAIVSALSPRPEERTVTKSAAGAFTKTDLDGLLRRRGISKIIVGGLITHLAVDSTVRDGALLGYRVLLARDACATRDLPAAAGPGIVDASTNHRAAVARSPTDSPRSCRRARSSRYPSSLASAELRRPHRGEPTARRSGAPPGGTPAPHARPEASSRP